MKITTAPFLLMSGSHSELKATKESRFFCFSISVCFLLHNLSKRKKKNQKQNQTQTDNPKKPTANKKPPQISETKATHTET